MNLETLKNLTILYVEDEIHLQEDVSQNILPFVNKIYVASNGQDGLEQYLSKQQEIDLIITDISMPKLNGIEMVNKIRDKDLNIPIIYTTAFNDSDYILKTIEQSVTSYILKPIDIELLINSMLKASLKIENENLKVSLQTLNEELEKKVDIKTKELQTQNKKLYNQLYTDELTSLPNRKALLRDIKSAQEPVLSVIDIDSFKSINDLYGELVGNQVLIKIATILKEFAQKKHYHYYRIGSDEFAILRDDKFDINKCEDTINSIIKNINSQQLDLKEYNITISIDVTIGISKDKKDILEKADMALKKAKIDKVSYLVYNNKCNFDNEYKNDIKWTKLIKKAIETDNIIPFYQAIVDKNGKIIKYESLMRLIENNNTHTPLLFLDIAKKVKFYPQLTKIMINKAFKKVIDSKVNISINLSIQDITNEGIVKFIIQELSKNKISDFITFELLENESIDDYETVINFINTVKELGCKIAIDDFGSGYSNFIHLLKLKPDYIKIDGSSVKNIDTDTNSYLITKTINDFAHHLGIKTVAEYVHNKKVFKILKKIGIDEYQGYYFSKPNKNLSDFS